MDLLKRLLSRNSQPRRDRNGGIVPDALERAKKVDLITLPEDTEGTNCFNCLYVHREGSEETGFCTHQEVLMKVNDRNCCARWDADGVIRAWKHDDKGAMT